VTQSSQALVFTIGHSTRSLEEFIALLKAHQTARLVDVRTVPRSRKNPQFNSDTFPAALSATGISYAHAAGLGGFRRASPQSPNTGWRNASFRGYADYMQTAAFAENMADLVAQAAGQRLTLMCAEAVPWRCHRSLIADALLVRGVRVEEIVSEKRCQVHALTSFARVEGCKLVYPPPDTSDSIEVP
jgi:uncharacterized protein (DUF488 family)